MALGPLPDEPLVSVCIPAFNAAHFIEESLSSILAQTYHRLEVVVVDDASTDATRAVVARFDDPRVRCVRNAANVGAFATTCRAVSLANGQLVAIYHADDVYDRTIVEKEVGSLKRHASAGAVFTQNRMIREDGSVIGTNRLPTEFTDRDLLSYEDVFRFILCHKNILLCTPTFMGRREALAGLEGFGSDRYHIAYDLDMWIRVLRRFPIAIIDEPLMSYRHSSGQFTSRYGRLRVTEEIFFELMDDYIRADGWTRRLTASDLREYDFHRLDDMTVRAVHHVVLGDPAKGSMLLRSRFAWRSLVTQPTRRKARVLLMRLFLRTLIAARASHLAVPLLTRTERIR
jgi:glycosyltransferase involved in cell wall biosynthesis